jgi:putative transposase
VVLQTHGRPGPSQPHRPVIAPSGDEDGPGARWEPLQDVPDERLRRKGPWQLLSMVRHTRQPAAVQPWGATCLRQSPNAWVTNVQQGGSVPSPSQSVARDVAKEVVRPPSAVRRIDGSDGERGTDHARSHRTARVERATVAVATLIGRRGQHTVAQGCKRMRYDGMPATKPCAKMQVVMHAALAKVEGVGTGAVPSIARLT